MSLCILYDVGIQLFYIVAMILSNYCIYHVDVKIIVLSAYCKYTDVFVEHGSKEEQFVTDCLYPVYLKKNPC